MSGSDNESTRLQDKYRKDICLKLGRVSCTYLCTDQHKYGKCVVKVIDYSNISFVDHLSVCKELKNQCHRYEKLMHKHIAQLYESYVLSDRIIFLVYEHIIGNDLLAEIVSRGLAGYVYSENVVSYYMNQIMDAIDYCHDSGIVHGNIKIENIMIASQESGQVKLCGFGRALLHNQLKESPVRYFQINNLLDIWSTHLAPELAQECAMFSKASDIYSAGVLLLTLLCGSALNFDSHINFFSIEEKIWNNISDTAKEIVLKMLNPDPIARITAKEVLNHKWISEKESFARKTHLNITIEEMKRYHSIRSLKKKISLICFTDKFDQNMNLDDVFNADEYNLLGGVLRVIETLDKILSISSINSRQDLILDMIVNDSGLNYFLKLFDFVYNCVIQWKRHKTIDEFSAFETYHQVLRIIECLPMVSTCDTTLTELLEILYSPNIQLLLQTHDIIQEILLNHANCDESSASSVCNHLDDSNSSQVESGDELISPLRLVEFQKNINEPLGITLKMDEWGRCVVSRILHGGLIHRQGTLHVGDVIREINDIPVSNQSADSLQRLLRDPNRNVFSFKILPNNGHRTVPVHCQTYLRAQFDYNPRDDDLIPSIEIGLTFNMGDILEIISKDDYYWWQARKEGDKGTAGLIPSPELVEWRIFHGSNRKSKKDGQNCIAFGKKKKRDKCLNKLNALIDELDVPSYEEVIHLSSFKRKTLVLLGAHGIGRRHIKNTLISNNPDKYSYPIPHTTREPRRGEQNGKHYFFVSHQEMLDAISCNQFLEYGTHEEAMYGTKLETIKDIIRANKVPILDVEPQALKLLRSGDFSPFVVFIAAPSPSPSTLSIEDSDGSLQRLTRESEILEKTYSHLFDLCLINNDIEETVRLVEKSFDDINSSGQWVPCHWVY